MIIRWFLNICALIGGLLLIAVGWGVIVAIIKSVWNLIHGYTFKEILPDLNIFKDLNVSLNNAEKKYVIIAVLLASIGLVYAGIGSSPLASTQIGSILEKDEYTEYYYVNMYPENSISKNYHVKAKIYVYTEQWDEHDYERRYEIQEAYFPNGGSITFYDMGGDESLQVDEKVSVRDDDRELWDIELTTNKAP